MAKAQQKTVFPSKKQYQSFAKKHEPSRPVLRNCLRAFWVGGTICLIGQGLNTVFMTYFDFTQEKASNPTIAVLIILSVLLTGFGVYDKLAQYAGAGSAVPVTGFANSIASAAIEHRTEGYVLGVGGNMFRLAGSVIVFGVVSAFVVALVTWVVQQIGGL